ncbi:hypothetical protein [Streptomyces puniciscabiei]
MGGEEILAWHIGHTADLLLDRARLLAVRDAAGQAPAPGRRIRRAPR